MTTIIVDRLNKAMYSDSQVTCGNRIKNFTKIRKINDIIYGVACDDYSELDKVIDFIENNTPKPKKKFKSNFEIIVLKKDGTCILYEDNLMEEYILKDYFCIGSGAVYLETVFDYQMMYDKKINIKKAMELAFKKDVFSSGPIQKLYFK